MSVSISRDDIEKPPTLTGRAATKALSEIARVCPSLMTGLSANRVSATLMPLVVRMEREGLIVFAEPVEDLGGFGSITRVPRKALMERLVLAATAAAKDGFVYFVERKEAETEDFGGEWGAPEKITPESDTPQNDPLVGSW